MHSSSRTAGRGLGPPGSARRSVERLPRDSNNNPPSISGKSENVQRSEAETSPSAALRPTIGRRFPAERKSCAASADQRKETHHAQPSTPGIGRGHGNRQPHVCEQPRAVGLLARGDPKPE